MWKEATNERLMSRISMGGKLRLTPTVISQLSNGLSVSQKIITHTFVSLGQCEQTHSMLFIKWQMLKSRDQLSSFCLDSCGFQSKHICVTKDWAALSRTSVCVSYFTLNTAKFPQKIQANPHLGKNSEQGRQSVQHLPQHAQLTANTQKNIFLRKFRIHSRGKAGRCKYVCTVVSSPRFKWQIVGFPRFKHIFLQTLKDFPTSENISEAKKNAISKVLQLKMWFLR